MIFAILSVFILAAAALFYTMSRTDPAAAGVPELALVYFVIFAMTAGAAAALSMVFRLAFPIRQGVLFGLLACLTLWLLANSLFSLLTGLLVLGIFVLMELYAISR